MNVQAPAASAQYGDIPLKAGKGPGCRWENAVVDATAVLPRRVIKRNERGTKGKTGGKMREIVGEGGRSGASEVQQIVSSSKI